MYQKEWISLRGEHFVFVPMNALLNLWLLRIYVIERAVRYFFEGSV